MQKVASFECITEHDNKKKKCEQQQIAIPGTKEKKKKQ